MKILFLITMLAGTLSLTAQERTVNVTFDGYDDDGYSFVTITNDPDTAEYLYFTDVKDEWVTEFALQDENTVNQQFTITYSVSSETVTDEFGEELTEEVFTLLSIKKK